MVEPEETLKMLPSRISEVGQSWVQRLPEHPALVESTGSWTYKELASRIRGVEAWLIDSGVRPGDRVMIVGENCRAFVAILLAAASIDAWPVLVNARISAEEVDRIRAHCGARRVIYIGDVSVHARKHAIRHGASVVEAAGLEQVALGPLNEKALPEPLDPRARHRVAALIYTSGTTGMPKGIMLTHQNLLFMAAISARIRSVTPNDRLAGILPMTHAVGLSVVLLGTLIAGASLYISPRFDPVALLTSLERDRLTIILGTPSMFGLLLEYAKMKGVRSLNFPDLRIISSSGAPLQSCTKAQTEALFGMVLHNGYGVTECSPTIALTRVDSPRSDTSVGRIFPGIEVKLVRTGRQAAAEPAIGELWVRGPNVMKGYYRASEETAEAIDTDGWFNTRDLARITDDHLFIVGRTKDLIVRFAFNVYPAEVEAVLNGFPGVLRSAVVGRAVQGSGDEEVIAFVQLAPDARVTANELSKYTSQHLAPYKQPSHFYFVYEMPLTPTGKIVKDELLKRFATAAPIR